MGACIIRIPMIKGVDDGKKQYKHRCDVCHSILDVLPEDRTLTFPCPICGNYATLFYLENSNQIFEVKNGELCLVLSSLSAEEREQKEQQELMEARRRYNKDRREHYLRELELREQQRSMMKL